MDQPKANVIKTFGNGNIELRLTDKGAVTVYRNTDRGIKFSHALKPSDVKLHAELGSPCFQEIVGSPEWASIQEAKEVNKTREYMEREKAKVLSTALKYKQAAFDKLTAMGLSQEQIESILKVG
jgi:hypothetical protein